MNWIRHTVGVVEGVCVCVAPRVAVPTGVLVVPVVTVAETPGLVVPVATPAVAVLVAIVVLVPVGTCKVPVEVAGAVADAVMLA